jgi:hypothetical protein
MAMRAVLRGQKLYPVEALFEVVHSRPQGHVDAVRVAMSRLGLPALLGTRPSPERDRVLAMIAARILAPHTKLATTRWWHATTLAEDFGVADATEQDLYAAMDWLLEQQDAIQSRLAARHLPAGSRVLYDLSSSYFEGVTCPPAQRGYNRDRKSGKLQVNYGLLTDARGCPVAVSVHEGNTADPATLMPEIHRLKQDFGIAHLVMIGDRGMISQKAIEAIRSLIAQGQLQLDLFDERTLFEFSHPDDPGERLVACRNPQLARLRAHKREALLQATEKNLAKVQGMVQSGRLAGEDKIDVRVGKVVNQYKVAKHFTLDIRDAAFCFQRKQDSIASEAALDGLYIIRTSVPTTEIDSADCVRHYKSLANVERAFRTMKTIDLKIRPIHHRLADRVRAHIFLCMLAYYVEWHLREAWRELLFADEDQAAKQTRDPVVPATRSNAAKAKAATHRLDDGSPAHSLATLLAELSTIVRNSCRAPGTTQNPATFQANDLAQPQTTARA